MIQTLTKNWWLLAFCGFLNGIISFTYLIMQDQDGSLTLRNHASQSTVVFLGRVALVAGASTVAAGVWRSTKGKCLPLVLNGLALTTLGLIFNGIFGFRIGFRTIALLVVAMSISLGILEMLTARTLRRHVADAWVPGLAGVAAVGFALAYLWITPETGSHSDIYWVGAYFGFSAICMLGLALRLHCASLSQSPYQR